MSPLLTFVAALVLYAGLAWRLGTLWRIALQPTGLYESSGLASLAVTWLVLLPHVALAILVGALFGTVSRPRYPRIWDIALGLSFGIYCIATQMIPLNFGSHGGSASVYGLPWILVVGGAIASAILARRVRSPDTKIRAA